MGDMNARLARDASLWNALPPLNAQLGGIYGLNHGYANTVVFGAGGKSMKQLEAEYGQWKPPERPPTRPRCWSTTS